MGEGVKFIDNVGSCCLAAVFLLEVEDGRQVAQRKRSSIQVGYQHRMGSDLLLQW